NNVNVYRLNSENSFMKNKLTLNQNGSNKPQKKCQPISGLDKGRSGKPRNNKEKALPGNVEAGLNIND
ncbi:MAG: hypothetical protein LHW60_06670, partial [Candidatus Cloacimonetes bacterium]|nr:hypothetical protein [Candidatus Cloacimonadota bacterium]